MREQISAAEARRNGRVRFVGDVPGLGRGVAIEHGDGYVTCRVEGSVRPFLAAIADAAVVDLTIEPARLEEAFLEFYDEAETT